MNDPYLIMCGVCCLWPILIGVLPTWLFMRYRVRLQSPIHLQDREGKLTQAQIREIVNRRATNEVGFGQGPRT